MVKQLTQAEKRKIYLALPTSHRNAYKKHCISCRQRGGGIMDMLKAAWKYLGPVAKEVGPEVLKSIVLPWIANKVNKPKGQGLRLAGKPKQSRGSGTHLAGKGRKKGKGVHPA